MPISSQKYEKLSRALMTCGGSSYLDLLFDDRLSCSLLLTASWLGRLSFLPWLKCSQLSLFIGRLRVIRKFCRKFLGVFGNPVLNGVQMNCWLRSVCSSQLFFLLTQEKRLAMQGLYLFPRPRLGTCQSPAVLCTCPRIVGDVWIPQLSLVHQETEPLPLFGRELACQECHSSPGGHGWQRSRKSPTRLRSGSKIFLTEARTAGSPRFLTGIPRFPAMRRACPVPPVT